MSDRFLLTKMPRYECLEERSLRYPDLDAASVHATITLMHVAQEVFDGFNAQFERNNISQGRFLVLMILDRHFDRPLAPSEIAEMVGVARATITGLLDGLEKEGLVARQPHPEDRRALTIQLTSKGREFLDDMLPGHYRRIAGLMANLEPEERRLLVGLLTKVAAGICALKDPDWDGTSAPDSACEAARAAAREALEI